MGTGGWRKEERRGTKTDKDGDVLGKTAMKGKKRVGKESWWDKKGEKEEREKPKRLRKHRGGGKTKDWMTKSEMFYPFPFASGSH